MKRMLYFLLLALLVPPSITHSIDKSGKMTEPLFYFYVPPSEKIGYLNSKNGELRLAVKPTFNPRIPQTDQIINHIYIYDKNGHTKANVKVSNRPNLNLAVSPNGKYFATNTQQDKKNPGGSVHLYSSEGKHVESYGAPAFHYPHTFLGFSYDSGGVILSSNGNSEVNRTDVDIINGPQTVVAWKGFDFVSNKPLTYAFDIDVSQKDQRAHIEVYSFQSRQFTNSFTVPCEKYAIDDEGIYLAAQVEGKVNIYIPTWEKQNHIATISIPRDPVWMMKFLGQQFLAIGGKKLRIYDIHNPANPPQIITNDSTLYFVDATPNPDLSQVYTISQTDLKNPKPYVGVLAAYQLNQPSKRPTILKGMRVKKSSLPKKIRTLLN